MKKYLCLLPENVNGNPDVSMDGATLFVSRGDMDFTFNINEVAASIDANNQKLASLVNGAVVDALRHTFISKGNIATETLSHGRTDAVIIVPFAGCTDDDIVLLVNGRHDHADIAGFEKVTDRPSELFIAHMPVVEFSVVQDAGGVLDIGITLKRSDGSQIIADQDVYLEATAGALNINRVRLIGGAGSVTLDLSGVPSGTWLKIKGGFKFFSGAGELEMTA